MASIFKTFDSEDQVVARTLMHEAIPISGSLLNDDTYSANNIKEYAHGMFQDCYDYPFTSSSANKIMSLSVGVSEDGDAYPAVAGTWTAKKLSLYNSMAKVLMGHDTDGSILHFDQDGDLVAGGTKYDDVFIINFSRLLVKDEIRKGTFSLELGIEQQFDGSQGEGEGDGDLCGEVLTIEDDDAENDYRVNSPVGEYGILRVTSDTTASPNTIETNAAYDERCGLIFYQAGIVILTHDIFNAFDATTNPHGKISSSGANCEMDVSGTSVATMLRTGSIEDACDALRARWCDCLFNNTTELNSSIYFCRVGPGDMNYSSNPTYTSGSKIVTKRSTLDAPVSYMTTIGLYGADNALLAVAKLSEPLKITPDSSQTIRIRIDY
jgi:hypothetical protein